MTRRNAIPLLFIIGAVVACAESTPTTVAGDALQDAASADAPAAETAGADTAGAQDSSGLQDAAVADTASAGPDSAANADSKADAPLSADVPPPTPKYNTLAVSDLADMLKKKDFVFLNVHVPYAGQIPATDAHIGYTKVDDIEAKLGHDKGKKTVLYCLTGPMSKAASQVLVNRGYHAIWDLPGGMVAWQSAGYTIETK